MSECMTNSTITGSTTDPIIIHTMDLTKVYGPKAAVDHLNLEIRRGEVFGLLGPNGAGKTTTILMLLGLTEPTQGKALIDGHDCTRESMQVKMITGYLPDNVGFYADMTGRENLRFTARLNGIPEKEIDPLVSKLLERVGMTYAADQKTGTYSKGMRQRLGIADVLIKDPEVIIMDEPTLGLDPEGMREFLNLIKQLSVQDKKTILVSSHQLYQIQQICDRVGIFVNGSLIACGGIDELGSQIAAKGSYTLEVETVSCDTELSSTAGEHQTAGRNAGQPACDTEPSSTDEESSDAQPVDPAGVDIAVSSSAGEPSDAQPCDDRFLDYLKGLDEITAVTKEGNTYVIHSSKDLRSEITKFLGTHHYTLLNMHQKGGDLDEIYRVYFEEAEKEGDEKNGKYSGRTHRFGHRNEQA